MRADRWRRFHAWCVTLAFQCQLSHALPGFTSGPVSQKVNVDAMVRLRPPAYRSVPFAVMILTAGYQHRIADTPRSICHRTSLDVRASQHHLQAALKVSGEVHSWGASGVGGDDAPIGTDYVSLYAMPIGSACLPRSGTRRMPAALLQPQLLAKTRLPLLACLTTPNWPVQVRRVGH